MSPPFHFLRGFDIWRLVWTGRWPFPGARADTSVTDVFCINIKVNIYPTNRFPCCVFSSCLSFWIFHETNWQLSKYKCKVIEKNVLWVGQSTTIHPVMAKTYVSQKFWEFSLVLRKWKWQSDLTLWKVPRNMSSSVVLRCPRRLNLYHKDLAYGQTFGEWLFVSNAIRLSYRYEQTLYLFVQNLATKYMVLRQVFLCDCFHFGATGGRVN